MTTYRIGDLVEITDAKFSSIPMDEEGHMAEVISVHNRGGRMIMRTGPRANDKTWWFCDRSVSLREGGPW